MKKPTEKAEAVKIVQGMIKEYEDKLHAIMKEEEPDPIMITGITTMHYECNLMVDPRDVAKIMLDYEYPMYHVLDLDAPDGMWEELGYHYGLTSICEVPL